MYQRIRDLREDRDLMQKDLAAYLKCTQVCYSNYETGKRDIPTDVLKALSDERIVMRFNSNVSPCVICPVEGESYLYLVLPVRVFNA